MMRSTVSFDFTGKTVLVTGSTQNLGLSIAMSYAEAGACVVLHGVTQAEADATLDQLLGEHADWRLEALGFDLSQSSQIEKGFAQLEKGGIMPDILVNNAAHLGLGVNGFLEQTPEFFRDVLEVNLLGAFRCSQLAAARMIQNGGGSIVNISSLAGERVIPRRSAYSVGKAALDNLTRSMAVELAAQNIRVNAVVAGYIWTERWNGLTEEVCSRRRANTPAGQPTQQREIAQTVLFLSSDAAPTLNGARIVIDGGLGIQQLPSDIYV